MLVDRPAFRILPLLGVNCQNDALTAEFLRTLTDQFRIVNCCGIYGNLIRSRAKDLSHIFDRAYTAADRERNEDLITDSFDHIDDRLAIVRGRRDIEEYKLISAFQIICFSNLDRISGIFEIDKIYTFYYSARVDIEAGNDSFCEHDSPPDMFATFYENCL